MTPLKQLLSQQNLSAEDTERLFGRIVRGDMDDVELTAILIALKMKGESPAEILGAARALRQAALPFDRPDGLFADTAGTGGDGGGESRRAQGADRGDVRRRFAAAHGRSSYRFGRRKRAGRPR